MEIVYITKITFNYYTWRAKESLALHSVASQGSLPPNKHGQIQYNQAMPSKRTIQGVFTAAVTPLKADFSPDLPGLNALIHFLAQRGCHGVLLLGTTGEGPSFSPAERSAILQAGIQARKDHPELVMLAGTGTPSLDETISLTRSAFELGYEGVLVLPPYYYRKASDQGLFGWYSQVLDQAVPSSGSLFGYHIPPITGVGLSLELLARLKDAYPDRFAGIKDSSADAEWATALGERFGGELTVLTGNDRLFSLALRSSASGCITAMANVLSPLLREIWELFQAGRSTDPVQSRVTQARQVLDKYQPMPPLLKALLHARHGFPAWSCKPPLMNFDPNLVGQLTAEFQAAMG